MRITGSSKGKVGPWTPNMVRRIAEVVNAAQPQESPPGGPKEHVIFAARITGAESQLPETRVWKYLWEEVFYKNDGTIEIEYASRRKSENIETWGKAYNGCEGPQFIKTYANVIGPGVTLSLIPLGFNVRPIATDTIVIMHLLRRINGQPLYLFSCPNAIDGFCY